MNKPFPRIAPAPLVDTHAHVFTADMPLKEGAWHKPAADADAAQYVQTLEMYGIRFGVLAAASISGYDNTQTLQACRLYPRLRTTVILPPDCSLQEMRELSTCGVVGVRFQWRHVQDVPDLGSGEYRQLLRNIADLGWHVQLHDDAFRLPLYLPALEDSGVNVVVDHFGRPDTTEGIAGAGFQRLLRSIAVGRTWVKLSAPFRLQSEPLVRQAAAALIAHAGPERLMWGSDWPFAAFESRFSYPQAIESLQALVPNEDMRRRISSDTPFQFYFS